MKILECGTFTISISYHIIVCVSSLIRFLMKIEMNQMLYRAQNKEFHPIFYLFLMFLSETLGGVCIVFQRKRVNGKDNKKQRKLKQFSLITNNDAKTSLKRMLLILFSLFCLDFLSFFFGKYNEIILQYVGIIPQIAHAKVVKDLFVSDLLCLSLLSYFLLHYPLFPHIIISNSLFLIAVGFIIIPYFFSDISKGTTLYVIFTALSYICDSFLKVGEKMAMQSRVITFTTICFYEGLVGMTLTLLISSMLALADYFIQNEVISSIGTAATIFNEFGIVFSHSFLMFLYFFLWILSSALYNLFLRLVNCNYTPMCTFIGVSFSSFFCFIYYVANYFKDIEDKYYSFTGYIILLFGILVYNDILILRFCNIQSNTRKEIIKRSQIEYESNILELETNEIVE